MSKLGNPPHPSPKHPPFLPVFGVGEAGTDWPWFLLHPLGMSPTSLLLLIVEEMALGVSPNGGGSLDQLPGIGVHTPALSTLSIQRHLALKSKKGQR